jgi:hypothetical protein
MAARRAGSGDASRKFGGVVGGMVGKPL